jgi:nucleoside-diphosphate-sugar epimerase
MRKAIVTGSNGFVGRHVCEALLKSNKYETIYGFDTLMSESALPLEKWPNYTNPDAYKTLQLYADDCRNLFTGKYFTSTDSDFSEFDVIHLAAVVGGRSTIEGSPLAVAEDLSIDAMFFKWLQDLPAEKRPKNIVYFSSSAAYPIKYQTHDELTRCTLRENMIDFTADNIGLADMSYGWSKLTGEYLAFLAKQKNGIDCIVFRPFSGYGEDQHTAYPFPAIMKRVFDSAMAYASGDKSTPWQPTIDIWSDTVRDFIHIDDCVAIMMNALGLNGVEWKKTDSNYRVMNLGTGIDTSFSELATKAIMIAAELFDLPLDKSAIKINILSNKPAGVQFRVSDTAYAEQTGMMIPLLTIEQGITKKLLNLALTHGVT